MVGWIASLVIKGRDHRLYSSYAKSYTIYGETKFTSIHVAVTSSIEYS